MNIKDVKTAFKVADVVLDEEHEKNYIKMDYLSELIDEKGNKLERSVLEDNTGRVYIIVVNRIIKKISGSQSKGGIKATLSFYQSAMQGRPGLSRYGTHILVKEALEKGDDVGIYMIISQSVEATVKGLFSEEKMKVNAFKEMENKCKEDYKNVEGDWPAYIQESHNKYLATQIGKKRRS